MQFPGGTIVPILLCLAVGYAAGHFLPTAPRKQLGRLLGPLVWLLLLTVGREFGSVLRQASQLGHAAFVALWMASLTTLVPWALIVTVHRRRSRASSQTLSSSSAGGSDSASSAPGSLMQTLLSPLKECAIALSMVAVGVLLSLVSGGADGSGYWPSTTALLYLLVALVGIDLVGVKIDSAWLSMRTLTIPLLVVIGSWVGGILVSMIAQQPIRTALALSSGFGWFTLSAVLIGQHLGHEYGTIALLTDLFRELLAIVLLYGLGARHSLACIGAGGATSLDSTLPIIKRTCNAIDVPVALVSGLTLSLLAPFLMTLFLTHS